MTYGDIVKKGTYYYPATAHYGKDAYSIVCDRCQRRDLKCCIGYKDSDLCMECVQTVADINSEPEPEPEPRPKRTKMRQRQYRLPPGAMTLMQQSIFESRMQQDAEIKSLTRMRQCQFK